MFKQVTPVAIGHGAQRAARLGVQRQGPALGRLGAADQLLHRGIVEPVQHEDLATREQGAVQLEGRVFGRGADEDHGAVLDIGQEAVLLGAVEAVDFVDEQQRPLPCRRAGPWRPRRSCADRRRRRTRPTAARNADWCDRPAGARAWSCRSRAAPKGSSRKAGRRRACARWAHRAPADAAGRRSPPAAPDAACRPTVGAPGIRTDRSALPIPAYWMFSVLISPSRSG